MPARHKHATAAPASLPGQAQPGPRASADRDQGRAWPLAGGLVAVSLWGLAPVATRAAVTHLDPLPLLVLRLTVAAPMHRHWSL